MKKNWKKIWGDRILINKDISILEKLIQIDGFDSGAGFFNTNDWLKHINFIHKKIGANIKYIYEIGCGSGAFIYPFYEKGLQVGGIDYSQSLINIAKISISKGDFTCDEAQELNIDKKYNCLISHSVFQYFPNIEYAKKVIYKMIEKSTNKIVILDINDIDEKESLEKLRRGKLGKNEYNKKYDGLEHLYYSKDFFYNIAQEKELHIELFYSENSNYLNGKYRFNIILTK